MQLVVAGVAVLLVLGAAAAIALTRDSGGGGPKHPTTFERAVARARAVDDPDDIEVPDPERPGHLGDDPLSDRLADECYDGDPSSCDDLFRESFLGSEYEKYGGTCGERTKRNQPGQCAALYPDPDYADLRHQCADGDEGACDELFALAPDGSVDEHFGSVCGGRSDDELVGSCAAKRP
jgi:hypothetical protein